MTNLVSKNLFNKNRLLPAITKSNYLYPIMTLIKVD